MRASLLAAAAALAIAVPCCDRTPPAPPPLGEVLLVVDTDMPVPAFVNRLRVDLYAADGTWYASRDLDLSRTSDWPVSFALALADGEAASQVLVRLRAYANGEVRDYRGERFVPIVAECDSAACSKPNPPACCPLAIASAASETGEPRLLDTQGADITPPTEPEPLLAIDRLVQLTIRPSARAAATVLLRGACAGTMADRANAMTCIDTEGQLDPVTDEPTDADLTLPTTSADGTFHGQTVPCMVAPRPGSSASDGTPLHDEEVCVPGGMFVFGDTSLFGNGVVDDVPERIAIVPPMLVDKYEVTVGRWRDALARGFPPPTTGGPLVNDMPMDRTNPDELSNDFCTWSTTPLGREDFGLNCITWPTARALCQWLGGDLPTEVEFEYAASAVGRSVKTRYPWGGDDAVRPSCTRAVWGHGSQAGLDDECNQNLTDTGPLAVTAVDLPGGDRTPPVDSDPTHYLVDMGGNYAEWMVDAFASLQANCWASAPLESPTCQATQPPLRATRGGDWRVEDLNLITSVRGFEPPISVSVETGFRCVRAGGTP
jgi:formylglycine-generating enzyme required for sulfatase activity